MADNVNTTEFPGWGLQRRYFHAGIITIAKKKYVQLLIETEITGDKRVAVLNSKCLEAAERAEFDIEAATNEDIDREFEKLGKDSVEIGEERFASIVPK